MTKTDDPNQIKFDNEDINEAYQIALNRAGVFATYRTRFASAADPRAEHRSGSLSQARAAYEIARDDYAIAAGHFQAVVAVVTLDDDDKDEDDLTKVLPAIAILAKVALGGKLSPRTAR